MLMLAMLARNEKREVVKLQYHANITRAPRKQATLVSSKPWRTILFVLTNHSRMLIRKGIFGRPFLRLLLPTDLMRNDPWRWSESLEVVHLPVPSQRTRTSHGRPASKSMSRSAPNGGR
jgi:hypothetical protein